jgi:nitrogen fixation/metabolism regulation signal transduction histidine kinase
MLQQTLKSGLDNEKVIKKLNEDLSFLQEYAKEIMKLTLPDSSAYVETETIDIDKIKKTLNILLRKPLNSIKLSFDIQAIPSQKINTFKLIKVLYNATMNCIESLNNSKISNPEIIIVFQSSKIMIKDNGLGFPEKIIKKLNQEEIMVSSKENGSGIGTAIIKDIIKNMNGAVKFYNNNGAIVDIQFS